MFDKKANDNTTPYGYRFLPDNRWVPVLYYVDLFRYNSKKIVVILGVILILPI